MTHIVHIHLSVSIILEVSKESMVQYKEYENAFKVRLVLIAFVGRIV